MDDGQAESEPFGARLRRVRLAARISQEELAERTGLSVRAISDLERGRTRRPYPRTRRLLVDALRVPDAATVLDPRAGAGIPGVPRQLPAGIRHFVGRERELRALSALLDEAGTASGAVTISAVAGTAGIGKTALAIHWAHRVADRFPDGQLYVNLRGFDPGGTVMSPTEAVRRFLDALQVPADRIPADLDAQAALYRTLLANRRVIVVLDNAHHADQVRPLLPGSPGCLVVVTSRNQLTPLIAAEDAHPIVLDLLTADESRDLLTRRLGAHRVAAEPQATGAIINTCAGLPLALSIVAARAATHHRPLAALVGELADRGTGLDPLSAGDPATDVRSVFSWSYRTLTPAAARLFRLLGLHPGPDTSDAAAASLAAIPPAHAKAALAELTQANLLVEHRPHRYTLHDLLRAYAAELARTVDHDGCHPAVHRLLDHYLHTANTAAVLLNPTRDRIPLAPPVPGTTPEQLSDDEEALTWFTAECGVLLAVLAYAASTGFDQHTWQFGWTLVNFLERRGRWHDYLVVQYAGLVAAQRLGDQAVESRAHRYMATGCIYLGRLDDAHTHLTHALDLSGRTTDLTVQAQVRLNMAWLEEKRGRHAEGLAQARQALDLFQRLGHRRGCADALNYIGWYEALRGDHQQALVSCQQALDLYQDIGELHGQGAAGDSLGYIHHQLGQHTQATAHYQAALAIYRRLDDRYFEATILDRLGDNHHAVGDHEAARDAWRQALAILTDLNHGDADTVRAKVASFNAARLGT